MCSVFLVAFHLSCVFLAKEPNNVGTLTWVNVQPRFKVKKKVQSENGLKRKRHGTKESC